MVNYSSVVVLANKTQEKGGQNEAMFQITGELISPSRSSSCIPKTLSKICWSRTYNDLLSCAKFRDRTFGRTSDSLRYGVRPSIFRCSNDHLLYLCRLHGFLKQKHSFRGLESGRSHITQHTMVTVYIALIG
jgi:hypothetical protein